MNQLKFINKITTRQFKLLGEPRVGEIKYILSKDNLPQHNLVHDSHRKVYYQDVMRQLRDCKSQKPIQYIIGNWDFYNINILTREPTLIPRPETSNLVDLTLHHIYTHIDPTSRIRILDIGTGTGCISLAIAQSLHLKGYRFNIDAIDICKDSITLAKDNLMHCTERYNVNFFNQINIQLDDIDKYESNYQYDVIVSNPPYVLDSENIPLNVKDQEAHDALQGGEDGIKVQRKIFNRLACLSLDNPIIFLEINENEMFKVAIENLIRTKFEFWDYEFINDQIGKRRYIRLWKKEIQS